VALIRPSGSGETTFLNLVGGLDRPTSGELWLDGVELSRLEERGATLLLVTHDAKAASFADRIVHLRDGEILSGARATEV
jgi:putative ABC transport system ATP-binding protein